MKHLNKKLSVSLKSLWHRKVKGVPQYVVRVPDGNWLSYAGDFENERQMFGRFDTDSCWLLSPIKQFFQQLNYLYQNNLLPANFVTFLTTNNFIINGVLQPLSQRFIENLSGNKDDGGTAIEAWQLFQKYGAIPKTMLSYSDQEAVQFPSKQAFDDDYFNSKAVTSAMLALGKQFLNYVNIAYQRIGNEWTTPNRTLLAGAIKQAPLGYGVPVDDGTWNQTNVPACTAYRQDHEVTGYALDQTGTDYPILDNYIPYQKVLGAGYFIPSVVQGIVTVKDPAIVPTTPSVPLTLGAKIWQAVMAWFASIGAISPQPSSG